MISTIYAPDEYNGNGTTTQFAFNWHLLAKADMIVKTRVTATNTVATLVLDTDYTIPDADLYPTAGGTVTMTTAPATGTKLYFIRKTARTQLWQAPLEGPFASAVVEKNFDRLTMINQELEYRLREALKFPDTIKNVDKDVPFPVAGELVRWNTAANALENVSIAELAAATLIVPVSVNATDTQAVATHNLGNANARVIGMSATWQTTLRVLSQTANDVTIEFGTECPTGGGTLIVTVNG